MNRSSVQSLPKAARSGHAGAHRGSRPTAAALEALNAPENVMDRTANLFRALGDTSRLRLVAMLAKGPVCVSDIAEWSGEDLSTVSQRLRVLRSENLVKRSREGKHILYSLADEHIVELIANAFDHVSELNSELVAASPLAAKAAAKASRR